MTTTNGTYKICPDRGFSISLSCTGPSCSSLVQYNNLNCTDSGSESFQCTNGVICSGVALFTSDFEITQDNATVLQTQNVQINGTNFVVLQGGMGNATVLNGTSDATTTTSATPSTASIRAPSSAESSSPAESSSQVPQDTIASSLMPSVPQVSTTNRGSTSIIQGSATTTSSSTLKSDATCSQLSYSWSLLLVMFALSIFVAPNAALDVATIGEDIHNIFEVLFNGVEAFHLSQGSLAGPFDGLLTATCETIAGSAFGIAINIGAAFGACEEAMVSSEITTIAAAIEVGLTSYTGIAGDILEGLAAAEEGVAIAVEPAAIPAVLIANSALCAYLVTIQIQSRINNIAENLCEAAESAVSGLVSGPPTAVPPTTTSTSTTSTSSSTTSPGPSMPTSSSILPIPDVSNDLCASCELSVYFLGVQGLAASCNVAVPVGQGYDLAVLLCDSTYNGRYAAFCKYLCANQCVSYNIQDWIENAGSQWQPDATLALCAQDCPGFKGDGRCQSGDYCPCAQGSNTCKPSNC